MAITKYLDTHQVFTAADFAAAFPGSVTDVNLLARATRSGAVDRVRQGLYVSKSGQFSGAQADPIYVAAAAADDAVFCFLPALQLHGVLHNAVNVTQFYSGRQISRFEYAGQAYAPRRRRPKGLLVEILGSKQVLFDSFARESATADSAPEAFDVSEADLAKQVVAAERQRLFSPSG
ncbi:MAG: hypothetical protein LBC97_15660 [Bifidobacteriaceae bacterium]|jgi:hypothetical protein|nr:hypothetical protein [Bifidobacteriaceae bacterium]